MIKRTTLIILFFHYFVGFSKTNEIVRLIDISDSLLYINPDTSINYSNKALRLSKKEGVDSLIASSLDQLSKAERVKGNYKKAIELLLEAIVIDKRTNHKRGLSARYINLGVVYYYLNDFDKTIRNFKLSLEIDQSLNDSSNLSISFNNIGAVYEAISEFDSALFYYKKSLQIIEALNDTSELGGTYNNIGNLHFRKASNGNGSFTEALNFYNKALYYNLETNGSDNEKVAILEMLSLTHKELGNEKKAYDYICRAKKIAESAKNLQWQSDVYQNLAQVYSRFSRFDSAYFYLSQHIAVKDSLFNQEKSKQIAEMEAKYENVEKQKQLEIQQLELDKNQAEIKQHQILEYGLVGGVFGLLIVGITILFRYREKNKANILLQSKNQEIRTKNQEIVESIHYAKRLQSAILPAKKLVNGHLEESFIIYQPKDIVSGDFYWVNPLSESKVLFAAVDCTGHGVPGAFVSIVGYNLLNKMVDDLKISLPSEILINLNKYMADALSHEGETNVKDGMDISLCLLDKENLKLEFSGANNPLYIIRKGELIEIKGDKLAIGSYYFREERFFNNHIIDLQKNDMIYSFTDGYADQFGGPKGKKFMYKQFKKLLIDMAEKPLSEQKPILINNFEQWRGDLEQVDDICIIGVRV